MKKNKIILEGVVIPFNVKNKNGRIYTRESFSPEVLEQIQHKVENGEMIGESSMPPDGRPEIDLMKSSHLVTDVSINDEHMSIKCELLDTPEGNKIKTWIESGVDLSIASRSIGHADASGNVMIDEVVSYDFVTDPAFDTLIKLIDD